MVLANVILLVSAIFYSPLTYRYLQTQWMMGSEFRTICQCLVCKIPTQPPAEHILLEFEFLPKPLLVGAILF